MDVADHKFDLEERLLDFSAAIIRFTETVSRSQAGTHVAGQLLRFGTSSLPNHGEAQGAESAADFIHKLSICLKELRETRRWLRLAQRVPLVRQPASAEPVLRETEELIRIFFSSIATARKRALRKGGAVGR
jgi:four helix bundle protein